MMVTFGGLVAFVAGDRLTETGKGLIAPCSSLGSHNCRFNLPIRYQLKSIRLVM